jgi:chromosomal replication initiation ATPase DnaA
MENYILDKKLKTTPDLILSMVEEELEIPDLSIRKRTRELTQARAIYFKLARRFCNYASLSKIGKPVNRDHATVINGLKNYEIEATHDPYMNDVYQIIHNKLERKTIIPTRQQIIDIKIEDLLRRVKQLEGKHELIR